MASLIESGVSHHDCGTTDFDVGVSTFLHINGYRTQVCPQGRFTWQEADNFNDTLTELDLLLTGGRLTATSRETVRAAYNNAQGNSLKAAQRAIVMTTEFNTLGAPLPEIGTRTSSEEATAPSVNSYKAAVLFFFNGGADTFNMVVPQDCYLYDEYVQIRTDLALTPAELNSITTVGQNCTNFGIHKSLDFINTLYGRGQAAFVSNVGNLPEPTSMSAYKKKEAMRCFNLFSHNDQTNGAQTLKCQDGGTSAMGYGGRVGDALAAGEHQFRTTSFSIGGFAIWPSGFSTKVEVVSENSGSQSLIGYEVWRNTMENITAQRHGNHYADAYARMFLSSVKTVVTLQRILEGSTVEGYVASSKAQQKLHQVAKLISVRGARGAERDFFHVSTSRWDHHSDMKENLAAKFTEVDTAVRGFVEEMEKQNVWGNVVLATESEFARTLDSNGGGSDHAWAGNHFIIGGGLKGGRIFNRYPATVASGGPFELGRGRMIPEFPWESVAVPVASWLGVSATDLNVAFPNLQHFSGQHLIDVSDLFLP